MPDSGELRAMTIDRFVAEQLSNPSGIVGNLVAFLWNRRNASLNDVVFDSLALNSTDRILEVGFGGGYLLGRMSNIVTNGLVVGVDISPAMVSFCEKRYHPLIKKGKLELRRAQVEVLPYPSEYFTKACTVNSIFYWQDVKRALSEFERVLTRDGFVVICFTCKESLENRNFAKHVVLYEAEEIEQMAILCGFQVRTKHLFDRHRKFLCMTAKKLS
jgi:ubiquinone/menaquinone biosynthesis C-methylase UbiE